MGREWLSLYKANGGVHGGGGGRKSPPATAAKTMNRQKVKDRNTSSSGCMSVIFNLFDVHHHHQFRFRHPSFVSDQSTIINHQQSKLCLQGIEAPRSSLESPESAMDAPPSSSKDKEQPNLNIPSVGRIQIKTNRSRLTDELSSECSSSPGTKTPNLVARLMGLDLLPEYSSPRPSSSSTPVTTHHHSRSLPATPRTSTSTASRRSTDTDYHHRLSLQIDKENCNLQTKMARRRSELPVNRHDDDLKTQYAKQITNQVRERISRRLGTDITNTVSPAGSNDRRRDSDLVLLKPKKSPAIDTPVKSKLPDDSKRLLSNLNKRISNSHSTSIKQVKSKSETVLKVHKSPVKDEKIKRIASERFDLRLKKMSQQKSTTLSNHHVLNVKNTTKILSLKKEMTSSSSSRTRSSRLQISLPNSLNSPYKPDDTHNLKATTTATATATATATDHFDYISRILNQCGINPTTPISSGQWHSHSHPLHPSIFHQLENLHHPTTTTAIRRMVFELVNDCLVEILKPCMNHKPWVSYRKPVLDNSCLMYGSDLIGKLCEMIERFPAAHCEVLEDIDRLIERDIGRWWLVTAFEAEGEDLVKEIESDIMKNLVYEIATETVRLGSSVKTESHK